MRLNAILRAAVNVLEVGDLDDMVVTLICTYDTLDEVDFFHRDGMKMKKWVKCCRENKLFVYAGAEKEGGDTLDEKWSFRWDWEGWPRSNDRASVSLIHHVEIELRDGKGWIEVDEAKEGDAVKAKAIGDTEHDEVEETISNKEASIRTQILDAEIDEVDT